MELDFAWLGQSLAVDLVNTYVPSQRADLLDRWPELDSWPGMTRPDLYALRDDATTAIDHLIENAAVLSGLRQRINGMSRANPDEVTLEPDGRLAVRSTLVGAVARDLIRLASVHAPMQRCPAPGCGMVYLVSRAKQTWCSPSCGNRARVARHALRQRGSGTQHHLASAQPTPRSPATDTAPS